MREEELIRDFYIGSEWIYYKIYLGSNTANTFLKELNNVLDPLVNQGSIDSFFFIRYADPDFHLRIRFKVRRTEHLLAIIKMMEELITPFFQNYAIYKVQTDTYTREIERYGKSTMEASEELFYVDSQLILDQLSEDDDINDRGVWFKALKVVDIYLNAFDFSLEQKTSFIKTLAVGFSHEFPMHTIGKKQLALKYRTNRVKIEQVFEEELGDNLLSHANRLQHIAQRIREKVNFNQEVIEDLLGSYLHMHCNRFFSNKPRMNEWLVYDFLAIYYKSEWAKRKKEEAENFIE